MLRPEDQRPADPGDLGIGLDGLGHREEHPASIRNPPGSPSIITRPPS